MAMTETTSRTFAMTTTAAGALRTIHTQDLTIYEDDGELINRVAGAAQPLTIAGFVALLNATDRATFRAALGA